MHTSEIWHVCFSCTKYMYSGTKNIPHELLCKQPQQGLKADAHNLLVHDVRTEVASELSVENPDLLLDISPLLFAVLLPTKKL